MVAVVLTDPPGGLVEAGAFARLDEKSQALVAARASDFIRLPDGSWWDGKNHREFCAMFARCVDRREIFEHVKEGPIFRTPVSRGMRWYVRNSPEARAWGLTHALAVPGVDKDGPWVRADPSRLANAMDTREWPRDGSAAFPFSPPLWTSLLERDHAWRFLYLDCATPDPYARTLPGGPLRVTKKWGSGKYEVEGWSLGAGGFRGLLNVGDESVVRNGEIVGRFVLVPGGVVSEPGGHARPSWTLTEARALRVTREELAAALEQGLAELAEWSFASGPDGTVTWSTRELELRPRRDRPGRPARAKPDDDAPVPVVHGPDTVILHDGRYYTGHVLRQSAEVVVFRTRSGTIETTLELERADIARLELGAAEAPSAASPAEAPSRR